ncbi:MAG: hypothetical protein ACJASQ_003615 [Crocinitomicaceae bacterium]|jgi:hypothetical protein
MKISAIVISASLLALFSCEQQENEKKSSSTNDTIINEDTLKPVLEKDTIPIVQYGKMDSLLLHPFDLPAFKRKKRGANSSGGGLKQAYYFRPDTVGMYYRYFLFGGSTKAYLGKRKSNLVRHRNPVEITVYKVKDDDWNSYNDPNEYLIQLEAIYNDFDLPELAFIGWTRSEIAKNFGAPFYTKNNCMVYSKDNHVILFHFLGNRVDWLKYTNLNSNLEKDSELPNLYTIDMFQF